MSHTEVEVAQIPNCDLCGQPALYDCRTIMGPWAYLCSEHFRKIGVGLGLGKGQKLTLKIAKGGDDNVHQTG